MWRLAAVSGLAAPCSMLLRVTRHAGGVRAELRYAPARWSGAEAARVLAQYAALVEAAAPAGRSVDGCAAGASTVGASPGAGTVDVDRAAATTGDPNGVATASLPVPSGAQPWRTWATGPPAPTRAPVPDAPDVVDTICAYAATQPAQPAVRSGAAVLTYAALCAAAAGWAAAIADLPAEARVGLLFDRGVRPRWRRGSGCLARA